MRQRLEARRRVSISLSVSDASGSRDSYAICGRQPTTGINRRSGPRIAPLNAGPFAGEG